MVKNALNALFIFHRLSIIRLWIIRLWKIDNGQKRSKGTFYLKYPIDGL